MAKLSETLKERGYAYQFSSGSLEEITDGKKRTLYLGIDPSADSLQVGQLQGFLVLRRFLEDGHKVVLVIGGGTGLIGDPGGKNAERPLLSEAEVEANGRVIAGQAKRLFGDRRFTMVNNADWLKRANLIEFLRDVGKHFTVNEMIKREMVKDRIEDPDQSISFAEFSYMTLQAYDFAHLSGSHGVDVQVGGSDQWGNIISGVELIRRTSGKPAYAFTWPLLINKSTGRKFGKSEQGTIWLDEAKTPLDVFYDFWLRSDDADVEEYLLKMTLLPSGEIQRLMAQHSQNPALRLAQRKLAHEVTALVHGKEKAEFIEELAAVARKGEYDNPLWRHMLYELGKKHSESVTVRPAQPIVEVLLDAKLATSKSDARRLIKAKGVRLNGKTVEDEGATLSSRDLVSDAGIIERGSDMRILIKRGFWDSVFK